VYATYSTFGGTHVWRSANAGASWTPLDGTGAATLPDIPAHELVVDPHNAKRLYVGTDLGIYVSLDGGLHWAVENTGFPNVITESLQLNKVGANSTLFAFTHGRGAFRVVVPDVTPPNTTITGKPPARTRSRTAIFRFASSEPGSTFQCKLDGGSFLTCSSGRTYRRLRLGFHTFRVRAVDDAHNVDSSPASYTWKNHSVEPRAVLSLEEESAWRP
jgi:hypothetical protein